MQPKYDIIQTDYHNPHAEGNLKLNMVVVGNTPEKKLEENIRQNSVKYENWLDVKPEHDGIAVLVGGGWSINDCINEIKGLRDKGGKIISMNGSAKWLRDHGITPDWQVIVDAKEETAKLVDPECKTFFASQCDPKTTARAKNLTLVHFGLETIEQFLPEDRVKKGGYGLLGCGTTVGNAALSVAFSQGYRELHIFGYDSSYHDGESHGYSQPMNQFMPTTKIKWGGREFTASVAMKGQAEKFPLNALSLKNAGCELHVYGDGLLQTIYNTHYDDMTEKEKYQLMWNFPNYRAISPGEMVADKFLEVAKPMGTILDLGCGTGRGSLKLSKTNDVILVDFTDNCRDQEVLHLPFVQADLSENIPVNADFGFCTDVMEHIPTEDVDKVLENIKKSCGATFFQISLVDDACGVMIGQQLHLTVKPFSWWVEKLESFFEILWSEDLKHTALFYVR